MLMLMLMRMLMLFLRQSLAPVLLQSEASIRLLLTLVFGIDSETITEAYSRFRRRLERHVDRPDPAWVDGAFEEIERYIGDDLERRRLFVRLLFTVASADRVVVEDETVYGRLIGGALGLSRPEIERCAALGRAAGEALQLIGEAQGPASG